MSARVFNPMAMSEFQLMVSRSHSGNDNAGQVNGNSLQRVRKNLFGPVNHENNIKFVERELAAANTRDNEKWGFDFIKEKPIKSIPSRYVWERVMPETDNVPEPYALRRFSYLQKNADNTTCSVKRKSPVKSASNLEKPTSRRTKGVDKQSRITDYLKNCKRSSPKAIGIGVAQKAVDYKLRSHLNLSSPKNKKNLSSNSS